MLFTFISKAILLDSRRHEGWSNELLVFRRVMALPPPAGATPSPFLYLFDCATLHYFVPSARLELCDHQGLPSSRPTQRICFFGSRSGDLFTDWISMETKIYPRTATPRGPGSAVVPLGIHKVRCFTLLMSWSGSYRKGAVLFDQRRSQYVSDSALLGRVDAKEASGYQS